MRSVALIILAAGESKRLGQPKQLLPFRGRTLLRHAAETALSTNYRPIIVVVGAQYQRMEDELTDLDVQVVRNNAWQEGIASSIRTGIFSLISNVEGAVLSLCDQPFIPFTFYNQLAAGQTELVCAEYGNGIGVPAYFGRRYFPDLLQLKGDQGAKIILARNISRRISCPEALIDIDTPEEALRLK